MLEKKIRAFYEIRPNKEEELHISRGQSINFPPHLHEELELCWVQEGSMWVLVGTQWRELTAGMLAVAFPNTVHAYRSEGSGARFTMLICRPSLFESSLARVKHQVPICPFLEAKDVHQDIVYTINGLQEQQKQRQDREIFRAMIRLLLARLLSIVELSPAEELKAIDLTSRLVEHLSQNYLQPLTLESVAKALGVSRYHVSHVFSSRLKTNFSDYLNFLRLGYACELLQTTEKSISDVSLDAGFSSQRTFNRAFQKHYGLTPRQYRQGNKSAKR